MHAVPAAGGWGSGRPDRFRLPASFAGLLPEGETRRRTLARALHVTGDDEVGLLVGLGADTIGDVQVVPAGTPPPADELDAPDDFSAVSSPGSQRLTRVTPRSPVARPTARPPAPRGAAPPAP